MVVATEVAFGAQSSSSVIVAPLAAALRLGILQQARLYFDTSLRRCVSDTAVSG